MSKRNRKNRIKYKNRNVRSEKNKQETNEECPVNQKKSKIEDFRNIMTVIISFFALIISIISLIKSNLTLVPKFSIEVLKENNADDLNRTFKLYNVGGQIVNPTIEPVIQLELTCAAYDEYGDLEREYITLFEFSDYFSDDYFYENVESSFIIQESNANDLYNLMKYVESDLEKENMCIHYFAIKYYFKVTYSDYKGKERIKILYPTSNFTILNYQNDYNIRYFKNIELKEIKQKTEADIILPLIAEGRFVTTSNEHSGDQIIAYNESTKDFLESYKIISNYIINNFENNSVELDFDESGLSIKATNKLATDFIIDENGFVIGFIEAHPETNIITEIIALMIFLLLVLIIFIYFRKKKYKHKRSQSHE